MQEVSGSIPLGSTISPNSGADAPFPRKTAIFFAHCDTTLLHKGMDEVARPSYLETRGGVYRYRRRFPTELAKLAGREAFILSLRTGDRHEALRRMPAAEIAYLEAYDKLQTELDRPSIGGITLHSAMMHQATVAPRRNAAPLTDAAAAWLARQYFDEVRAALNREALPTTNTEHWTDQIAEVQQELATAFDRDDPGMCRTIDVAAARLLSAYGFETQPGSDQSKALDAYLRRAVSQSAKRRLAHLNGDFAYIVDDALFAAPDATSKPIDVSSSMTLSALVAAYDAEAIEGSDLGVKARQKSRAGLALLVRHFGPEARIGQLVRADAYAFRDMLRRLPANLSKRFPASMALADVVVDAEKRLIPAMNRETQRFYLQKLSQLLDFAADRGFIVENVAAKIKLPGKTKRREDGRFAYTRQQLTKMFNAPLYRGCVNDQNGFAKVGQNVIRRSRFWLPLIALFSGMRMDEILQLTPDHIMFDDEDGLPYFYLSPDMKIKSLAGYRHIPVHPELLRIGILEHVAEVRRSNSGRLFADVHQAKDETYSTVFSKRFATFLRSLDIKERGKKQDFHSFRHNWRDGCRQPGANADLVDELGGWSRGNKTGTSYGNGAKASQLRPIADGVNYGIDLSHLYIDR